MQVHMETDRNFIPDFGDLKRKYGISCIFQGMGARWPSEEEKWSFWSRLVHRYCGEYRESRVMSDLKKLIGEKDYFIITSNGECHFEMCGFASEKIYEVEGNWLTMQCAFRCHDRIYSWADLAEKMALAEQEGRSLPELIPRCPVCGGSMQVHMETDRNFIPDGISSRIWRAESAWRYSWNDIMERSWSSWN